MKFPVLFRDKKSISFYRGLVGLAREAVSYSGPFLLLGVQEKSTCAPLKRNREVKREPRPPQPVMWKRWHTRLCSRLLDNRHCAPAISRNRTRQHHAGIVRMSGKVPSLSLSFLTPSLWFTYTYKYSRRVPSNIHTYLFLCFKPFPFVRFVSHFVECSFASLAFNRLDCCEVYSSVEI